MTHGDGHARVPTTKFPLTASPNLWGTRIIRGSKPWLSPKRPSLRHNPAPRAGWPLRDTAGGGQDWRQARPRLLTAPTPCGGTSKGQRSQVAGVCPHPPTCGPGGNEGEVGDRSSPSPVPGGGQLRLRAVGSRLCWCWRPRSVTCHVQRAGLPQIRRQPCLLTNTRAACSPGAGGNAADVPQNTGGNQGTHEPPAPVTSSGPREPSQRGNSQHPPSARPPHHRPRGCRCCCPSLSPGAPPTQAPHDPRNTYLSRRTTPSMHAPKSTTELISARRSRRTGGMRSAPSPAAGRGDPARPGAPTRVCPAQRGARPLPAPANSEGYRPRRWWRWPGWCPWGWTSGRPAGPRSGWSRP